MFWGYYAWGTGVLSIPYQVMNLCIQRTSLKIVRLVASNCTLSVSIDADCFTGLRVERWIICDWALKNWSNTKMTWVLVNLTTCLFKLLAGSILIPVFPCGTGSAYIIVNIIDFWQSPQLGFQATDYISEFLN